PFTGALFSRYKWARFRSRFDELRLVPILDYRQYRRLDTESGIFRFIGGIESIADGYLWLKDDNLTIPVSLENTESYLFPMEEGDLIPRTPEKIDWDKISTLEEGAKVFVGGLLLKQNNRYNFVSIKGKPLMLIIYDCQNNVLTERIIRSGRTSNEYWNNFTPASIAAGALAQLFIAASIMTRPAFQPLIIFSLIALFVPILPFFPPGLLLTNIYRNLAWKAHNLRANDDLSRLPVRYLHPGLEFNILNTGEKYGFLKCDSLPDEVKDGAIPYLVSGNLKKSKFSAWYIFGVIDENKIPGKSKDPFVSFGILPGEPQALSRRYGIRAYILEGIAWFVLLTGIVLNIIFIFMILNILGLIIF
ncbi:MAG: hypothetical protein LBB81_00390, partial [Treponema sp.]|nr:hypothetical protein [Treponema sp.]